MPFYIAKEDVFEAIDKSGEKYGITSANKCNFKEIVFLLPVNADVVEVVRCKDCVHYQPIGEQYVYNGRPAKSCVWHARLVSEYGYCSEGVKKQ